MGMSRQEQETRQDAPAYVIFGFSLPFVFLILGMLGDDVYSQIGLVMLRVGFSVAIAISP
jgi:hypothetical protein